MVIEQPAQHEVVDVDQPVKEQEIEEVQIVQKPVI